MVKDNEVPESRIVLTTSLTPESFALLQAEAQRENRTIGEILDTLIIEGCSLNEVLPPESHYGNVEKVKRTDQGFDKINPI